MKVPPLSSMRQTSSLPTQRCTCGGSKLCSLGIDDEANLAFYCHRGHCRSSSNAVPRMPSF